MKGTRRTNGSDSSSDTVLAPAENGGGSPVLLDPGPWWSLERDEASDDVFCELPDASCDVDTSALVDMRDLGGLRGGKLNSLGVPGWERPRGVSMLPRMFCACGVVICESCVAKLPGSCGLGARSRRSSVRTR